MKSLIAFVVLTLFFTLGCGPRHGETSPTADSRSSDLKALYDQKQARALTLRDPGNGWLVPTDGDAMIWSAKYASTVTDVSIEAAEYPDAPGRFNRHPPPWAGDATTWSRDMAVAGLFPWAWLTAHRDVLERQVAYGKAHNWFMGTPLADGRTYYTPSMRGLLAKEIGGLGGDLSGDASWPSVWPAGLVDYEAHLQVMAIWLQGEVAKALADPSGAPQPVKTAQTDLTLDISNNMFLRLQEHASGEPKSALYAYVLGKYTGDQNAALTLLLDPAMPTAGYVRCNEIEQCQLAEWLFVAHLLLTDLGVLK